MPSRGCASIPATGRSPSTTSRRSSTSVAGCSRWWSWSHLKLTESQKKFNISAKVNGGGMSGQAGAVQHGIARALCVADLAMRPVLKKHGLLRRDPRMKERKKAGLKRARKAPQYTKR